MHTFTKFWVSSNVLHLTRKWPAYSEVMGPLSWTTVWRRMCRWRCAWLCQLAGDSGSLGYTSVPQSSQTKTGPGHQSCRWSQSSCRGHHQTRCRPDCSPFHSTRCQGLWTEPEGKHNTGNGSPASMNLKGSITLGHGSPVSLNLKDSITLHMDHLCQWTWRKAQHWKWITCVNEPEEKHNTGNGSPISMNLKKSTPLDMDHLCQWAWRKAKH